MRDIMNKEYTYIDGKAIISDENNKKTQSEYYDNLVQVLVKENLIQTMENKIQELEEKSKNYKKHNGKYYISIILPITVLTLIIGIPHMINCMNASNLFAMPVDTILGTMSLFKAISISFLIPLGATFELLSYIEYKMSIKKEKGINSELALLKKKIKKERENLKRLKESKTRDNECTKFRTAKVNDLQELKKQLNFYFNLGYNEEKYYKYYEQGQLDKKFQDDYSDIEIEAAKEYLKEKGPSLTSKKKKKTNNL